MNDKRTPNDPRPEFVTDEHLRFLDAIRESGSVNMFGAAAPLREAYPELSKAESREVLSYWMRSFAERDTAYAAARDKLVADAADGDPGEAGEAEVLAKRDGDLVSVTIPPGEYYLGDPCYFFTYDDWDKVLATCDTFAKPVGRAPNGDIVLGFVTAHGDGEYLGSDGFRYGVDAGLIGLVPRRAITRDLDFVNECCNKVGFATEVECTNRKGVMTFGHVQINTRDEGEGI